METLEHVTYNGHVKLPVGLLLVLLRDNPAARFHDKESTFDLLACEKQTVTVDKKKRHHEQHLWSLFNQMNRFNRSYWF